MEAQERSRVELPKLMDSMLNDKNEEIDHLKEQLAKKEKQLNDLMTIHLGDTPPNNGKQQMETKNSARTLSDIVSINSDFEEVEHLREPNAVSFLPHDASSLLSITSSRIKDSHNLGTTVQVVI